MASFCVAFKGAPWKSPDAVPLMVMQAMLGSWDKSAPGAAHAASPLAQALHANDLANSFMAFNTNYADTGLFGVHVSSDAKEALDDAAFCVMQELQGAHLRSQGWRMSPARSRRSSRRFCCTPSPPRAPPPRRSAASSSPTAAASRARSSSRASTPSRRRR